MRILFIHRAFPSQFRYIAEELARDPENQVIFLTTAMEGGEDIPGVRRVGYKPVMPTHGKTHGYVTHLENAVAYGQAAYTVARTLKAQGFVPDVIFGHSGWGPLLFMKDLFPDVPLLSYFEWFYRSKGSTHGFNPDVPVTADMEAEIRTKNVPLLLELTNCDYGICPTYWQRDQFPSEFNSKIKVLHDGVDTTYFHLQAQQKLVIPRINLDLSGAKEIVTYVATGMEPMRGFPQFMEAVSLLQKERPKCHVVVVGTDHVEYGNTLPSGKTYRQLMLETYEYDLSRLHFTGRLSLEEYRQVLWASSVHVYFTYPFILSWSMMEAMSCGCLVIGSNTPPVAEVIKDGVNGLLVEFFAPAQLAKQINDVLDNPDATKELRQAARQTILDFYDLQKLLPEQIAYVKEVAAKKTSTTVSVVNQLKPITKLPDYYNRVYPDLLACIPPDAKVVLEIGCGAGAMGAQYKQSNPNCRYVGLEINQQAAEVAAKRLNTVGMGDVEKTDISQLRLTLDSIDCLVYGDVLEHLRDPWAVLRQHTRYLREGGQVVACISNIQNWSILAGLLQGKWEYSQEGLLDNTHMRFFTLDSIKAMFADAGLQIVDVKIRGKKSEQMNNLQELLRPAVTALGADYEKFVLQSQAFQYVLRAVKRTPIRPLLIQSMLGETKVCSRVRITEPNDFLSTIPGVRVDARAGTVDLSIARAGEEKVFIWQRIWPEGITQQQQLLKRGYLMVGEMDDDPLRWQERFEKDNYLPFRACHGLQVSTEPLAEYLRQINPNVAVFPNQIALLPPPRVTKQTDIVKLFFGALNREEDWQEIMPEINRALKYYGKRLQVEVIHDKLFYEALATDHKQFMSFCSYSEYQKKMYVSDIALLPLGPTRFNSMKSDLKFLECAAYGAVALASPTVYEQTVQHGTTGYLYRSPVEFGHYLTNLIEDDDHRQAVRQNAYEWVKNNRLLAQHYRQRYAWYTAMLDALPALNEQLRVRAPELFMKI